MSHTVKFTSFGILINGKPMKGNPKIVDTVETRDGELYIGGVKYVLRDKGWEPIHEKKNEDGKTLSGNTTVSCGIGVVKGKNIRMEF